MEKRNLFLRILFSLAWFIPIYLFLDLFIRFIVVVFAAQGANGSYEGGMVARQATEVFNQNYGNITLWGKLFIWLLLSLFGLLPGTGKFRSKILGSLFFRVMISLLWFIPVCLLMELLIVIIVTLVFMILAVFNIHVVFPGGGNVILEFFRHYGKIAFSGVIITWLFLSIYGILPGTRKSAHPI